MIVGVLDQRAVVVVGDRLSVAATARTGHEGQERGTGDDGRASRDVRVLFLLWFWCACAHSDRFVDRYIPGYVFFGDGVREGTVDERGVQRLPPWCGQGLVLELDLERQLVSTSRF